MNETAQAILTMLGLYVIAQYVWWYGRRVIDWLVEKWIDYRHRHQEDNE